jgi:hypothetical protein
MYAILYIGILQLSSRLPGSVWRRVPRSQSLAGKYPWAAALLQKNNKLAASDRKIRFSSCGSGAAPAQSPHSLATKGGGMQ